MKQAKRLLVLAGLFLASIVAIHTIRAPHKVSLSGFRVACLPATEAPNADKALAPYAQVAHTSQENTNSSQLWRCYFKFSPQDLVCTPQKTAVRQGMTSCPHIPSIDSGHNKTCYLLNKKHATLIDLLQKTPPVPLTTYTTNKNALVKTWQEVRDILLGKE